MADKLRQGVLRQGILRQGTLRQGILQPGISRQGMLQQGILRPGILRQGILKHLGHGTGHISTPLRQTSRLPNAFESSRRALQPVSYWHCRHTTYKKQKQKSIYRHMYIYMHIYVLMNLSMNQFIKL